jgi:hypothetical protein
MLKYISRKVRKKGSNSLMDQKELYDKLNDTDAFVKYNYLKNERKRLIKQLKNPKNGLNTKV